MQKIALLCAWMVLAAGCAAQPSPLLRKVTEIQADGKRVSVSEEKLSAFMHMTRARLPKDATGVLALEKDMPEGTGREGYYAQILRTKKGVELRYFEQNDHLPRADRFYHRPLTGGELREYEEELKRTPLSAMARAAAPAAVAATQPTTEPAGAQETADEALAAVPEVAYRVTLASAKAGETVEVRTLGEVGASGVIGLIDRLCHEGGFACTYTQPIPANARVLYATPHRRVVSIWTRGEELRAGIMQREVSPDAEAALQWFAYREGRWEPTEEPSPDALEPVPDQATQPAPAAATSNAPSPASAPATAVARSAPLTTRPLHVEHFASGSTAVVPADVRAPADTPASSSQPAAAPSRFSNPEILPEEESWWSEPSEGFTTVWHYLPLSEITSQRLGFVVPTLVFDDAHAAINLRQKMLYILHDGHLIALPIPPAAFGRK